MRLDWIALAGFRSYAQVEWRPAEEVNLLVGPNGAGKSNLLEGIGYLSSLKSFRGAPDEALISYDEASAYVRGEVDRGDGTALIEVEIRRSGGRRAFVNRQRLARTWDLLGSVRLSAFLPDDLDLVKRGPAYRRQFLDDTAVQLWPGAHADQADYDRALRQRNAFLKQGGWDEPTLAVWDERVAQSGARVMARRARVAEVLEDRLVSAHDAVADRPGGLTIEYRSPWGGVLDPKVGAQEHAEVLLDALVERHRVDRERRFTTVGPHRDDPVLVLDGHDSRFHASQGEQRTVALALRLAAHRSVHDQVGEPPILLLDDVYSELDPGRAQALTAALPRGQIFVSTADPAHVPLSGRRWELEGGSLK